VASRVFSCAFSSRSRASPPRRGQLLERGPPAPSWSDHLCLLGPASRAGWPPSPCAPHPPRGPRAPSQAPQRPPRPRACAPSTVLIPLPLPLKRLKFAPELLNLSLSLHRRRIIREIRNVPTTPHHPALLSTERIELRRQLLILLDEPPVERMQVRIQLSRVKPPRGALGARRRVEARIRARVHRQVVATRGRGVPRKTARVRGRGRRGCRESEYRRWLALRIVFAAVLVRVAWWVWESVRSC
jgi:hypothetical protein